MKRANILMLGLLILLAGGCSSDDPGEAITTPPPAGDVIPETAAELMAELQKAYEDRDAGRYAELIHPDFQMILQDQTTLLFPDLGATLDRDEDVACAARMFSGQAVTDPLGESVPAVQAVSIDVWHAFDEWRAAGPGAPVPGSAWAPYEINILFFRGQEDTELNAKGQVHLYVTSTDTLVDGAVQPFYRLSGMIDLTEGGAKAVERANFGTIKGMYR